VRRLATIGIGVAIAAPATYAEAHNGQHPVINGPDKLGTVAVPADGTFQVPKVSLDCPPPEHADPCVVKAVLKSKSMFRLKPTAKRKIVTLGKIVRYTLGSNREQAPLNPASLGKNGMKLIRKFGGLGAVLTVNINQHEPIIRDIRLFLKSAVVSR
jgi:hypothetical protein